MADFDFPYHLTPKTVYPETNSQIEMGNGYVFASRPSAPPKRMFTLTFPLMKYYVDGAGNIDKTQNPQLNMAVLDDFYKTHETWKSFTYDHPVYGVLQVRFKKPLEIPEGVKGGSGAVNQLQIELVEV